MKIHKLSLIFPVKIGLLISLTNKWLTSISKPNFHMKISEQIYEFSCRDWYWQPLVVTCELQISMPIKIAPLPLSISS